MVDVTCWHPPSSLLPTPSLPSPSLSLSRGISYVVRRMSVAKSLQIEWFMLNLTKTVLKSQEAGPRFDREEERSAGLGTSPIDVLMCFHTYAATQSRGIMEIAHKNTHSQRLP